jgi:hypothetical protein
LTLNIMPITGYSSWWFMPVIVAAEEAEIRRTEIQSQPGQIVSEPLSQKYQTQGSADRVLA